MSESAAVQSGIDGKVTVTFQGPVAIVTMDAGENRANDLFAERMHKALDTVLENEDVKVMITIGVGKFWSNGLDLRFLSAVAAEKGTEEATKAIERVGSVSRRVTVFPIPTIAAINGHCYAFGSVFSLCHDYRIMQTDRGWWCLNEVHNGLTIVPETRDLIKSKIPVQSFHEATVMGLRYTGTEALKAGIVNWTSSADNLFKDALVMAQSILPKSGSYNRDNLKSMKEGVYGDPNDFKRKITKSGVESRL